MYCSVTVEVELLYHSRGKWVSLTIRFVNEEDPRKISEEFLASIKKELCQHMENVCRQGMRGFKYNICCQTNKAVCVDKEFGVDPGSLCVILNAEGGYSPENPRLYNPFDEPLTVKPEEFLRINCWFGHQLINVSPQGKKQNCFLALSCLFHSADTLPKGVNSSLIRVVATLVEAKWQKLAVFLERKTSAISQYKEKSDENLVRAMMIIEDWAEERGQEATENALIQACKDCGVHRDKIEAAYKKKS